MMPHTPQHSAVPESLSVVEGPLFDAFTLDAELLKGIHDLGFIRPTPIQAQAIPPILDGRDVLGLAPTGTGKTAAFVLPILNRLLGGKRHPHLRALILAPTRELALQSMEHLRSLSRYVHLKGAAIFGGVPMSPQIQALERGVDIISATPGRLLDHIYAGRIDFGQLEVVVLDEVDRMLDMGFLPDVNRILGMLPPKRQNLAFSATVTPEIARLLDHVLHDPVTIRIGQQARTPAGIRHAMYPVPRPLKTSLLIELIRSQRMASALVFTRTKIMADRLSRHLEQAGLKVSVLHGDRSQSQRLRALDRFRQGRTQILVATDIAARGIDIDDISHVINFDIPETPETYIHRIGRTARAEATGDAFSLVDQSEEPLIDDIEKALGKDLPRVTLPHFNYKAHGAGESRRRDTRRSSGRGRGPQRHGGGHRRR